MVAIYESKQNSSGRKIKFKAIKYIKNNKNHQKLEASASFFKHNFSSCISE
jgi:hypothetical protein